MWIIRRIFKIKYIAWLSLIAIVMIVTIHNMCFPDNCDFKATSAYPDEPVSKPVLGNMRNTVFSKRFSEHKLQRRLTNSDPISPRRLVKSVDCHGVLRGDRDTVQNASLITSGDYLHILQRIKLSDIAKNCTAFRAQYMLKYPVEEAEIDFSIAYTILVYQKFPELLHLLRAIYRDHNYYCIHVDTKSSSEFKDTVTSVAKCLPNVFIVSKPVAVVYAGFSRLEADLNCMRDLVNTSKNWKYVINLASQMFPLRTNLEIVNILTIYNGSNDIEGVTDSKRVLKFRYAREFKEVPGKWHQRMTNKTHFDPPHGISVVKGSAYGVFSRRFVEFALTNSKVKDFLNWTRPILSPDEYFWATLNHNSVLGAPGGYFGNPQEKPWLAAYASWPPRDPCSTKAVRGVCILGVPEINGLRDKKELFANKFYMDHQPVGLDCLEEWLYNRTVSKSDFSYEFYKVLPFINRGR